MIEYLKVEIKPFVFASRELSIKIKRNGQEYTTSHICAPDDLLSFFDQLFDCAKQKIFKALQEKDGEL